MGLKNLLVLSLTVVVLGTMAGKSLAQNSSTPPSGGKEAASSVRTCTFVDEDGDGFNDLAPDQDGDGIPDRLDPDTKPVKRDQHEPKGWFRFARLFALMMNQAEANGGGLWQVGNGETGLGQGPGQRTGFGPDSDGASGDGVDMGGRSQRRGGHR